MNLYSYTYAILKNIESRGLSRYDPIDIDEQLKRKRNINENDNYRKIYRTFEIVQPVLLRKLFRIQKHILPTTYYHLGMALLKKEDVSIPVETHLSARDIADQLITTEYDRETSLWRYRYKNYLKENELDQYPDRQISMPMHCLARVNIFLLALWRAQGDEEVLEIAVNSIKAALQQHNIRWYADGSASISYYYNSDENVLNVNSEFLQWLADIPAEHRPAEAVSLGHSILQMLLQEQNEDGSFYYYSKENMAVRHIPKTIDNHHTSYMLSNLVHILESDFPTEEEKNSLVLACQKGMGFSLCHLFDETTGVAKYMVDAPHRKAEAVTYSEAIVAMCAFLRSPYIRDELKERLHRILPKVMGHLLSLISLRDGSVPCENVFGIWTRMDSIRWGNGPALQAIFDYYSTTGEGF